MQRRTLSAAALVVLTAAAGAGEPRASMAAAQRAYHAGHYQQSLALFERLAGQRNAEAAECAGFMLIMGESMYGSQVRRDVHRAKVFLLEAAAAGRPTAGFLLNMVERTD